jgi:hypothetical protein
VSVSRLFGAQRQRELTAAWCGSTEWEARVQWKFRHEARLKEISALPMTARERTGKRYAMAEPELDEAKLV